jgi:hypothetical protein
MALTAPKDRLGGHRQEIQADRESGIGGGEGTAEEMPPAGCLTDETDYFREVPSAVDGRILGSPVREGWVAPWRQSGRP